MKFWNWLKSLFTKKNKVKESPKPIESKGWQTAWSDHLRTIIDPAEFSKASDIKKLRSDWDQLSHDSKIEVLVEFFKALAYYESSYNPNCQTVDVGIKDNKSTWSIGLLQLSVIDQSNLNIRMGFDFDALLVPENNLSLGVAIMVNQIKKRGKIFIPKGETGNPGVYWATLNPGNKFDKSEKIIAAVNANKEQKPAETLPTKPVSNETPWMDIAKGELGVKEKRGGENPRIISYHAVTTLKSTEDEVPWCSSFVSWCLERSGIESTKSAWARSYLNWGKKLERPKYGCVVVFSRGTDSGHVAFYLSEGTDFVTVIGGNQSDSVCETSYPKSRVLGYRWPKN